MPIDAQSFQFFPMLDDMRRAGRLQCQRMSNFRHTSEQNTDRNCMQRLLSDRSGGAIYEALAVQLMLI
jgi:hypothetical protein